MSGTRFSHSYLNQGDPTRDSSRMRERFAQLLYHSIPGMAKFLRSELGVEVDGTENIVRPTFWRNAALRDVLDAITIVYNYFTVNDRRGAEIWLASARRILKEENVGYRIDSNGSVHYLVDASFETMRQETVKGLSLPRYRNVLTEFERGISELDGDPQNPKGAVRGVFSAVEGMFRLVFEKAPRLGRAEIDQYLRPAIAENLKDNKVATQAAGKLLRAFAEWVDAAHFYRHESGHEEPLQPPLDLAVLHISQGISILRWLISVDSRLLK